jgi:hypothetical protein
MPVKVPLTGQEVLPFYESADEGLDRFQRIEVLDHVEGFLPTTQSEQVEAVTLVDFKERLGGAARHLAEVAAHQRGAETTDNMRAPRKLTRSYIDWALDAQKASQEMEALKHELDTDVNPHLAMATVVEPTQAGLLPLLRYYDLALLRQMKKIEAVGYDPQKVAYTPENPGIMYYLGEALKSWRVVQVRRLLPEAITHEANRQAFWLERLVEVKTHYPSLRAIAAEGIDKYYGRVTSS